MKIKFHKEPAAVWAVVWFCAWFIVVMAFATNKTHGRHASFWSYWWTVAVWLGPYVLVAAGGVVYALATVDPKRYLPLTIHGVRGRIGSR